MPIQRKLRVQFAPSLVAPLRLSITALALIACGQSDRLSVGRAVELPPDNRALRVVFNNDTNNVLYASDAGKTSAEIEADYRRAIEQIAETRFGVMAQNVGNPDPVIYRSREATSWSKYIDGHESEAMNKLLEAGTDPLQITIDVCHAHDVPVVASYRMNAEDFYEQGLLIQDFGRKHWHLAIPGAHCLDPAHPVVYRHRMAIFREVVENYDVQGIEFDFRRWTHMISDPLNNHPILTQMVRDARRLLDEVAAKKGKSRLLLGVRVGPSIDTPQDAARYAGVDPETRKVDPSCKELGLDVATWISEDLVDYVSPTLFWPDWPGLPLTPEFVALAKGRNVGIYPTIFPRPTWLNDSGKVVNRGPVEPGEKEKLQEYKDGFCNLALRCYEEGADGVSTYNWYFHLHLARMPYQWQAYYGYGMGGSAIQKYALSVIGDPQAVRAYQRQPWFWPPEYESLVSAYRPVDATIPVEAAVRFPTQIPVRRIPAGIADDRSPSLAILPAGETLLLVSHRYSEPDVDGAAVGKMRDETFLCRFDAQENKFSRRQRVPLIGSSPSITVASDGTLLVTTRLMANDAASTTQQPVGFVHRSTDAGKRWSATRFTRDDFLNAPPGAALGLTRNVLELSEGRLLLGGSAGDAHVLWESNDGGASWRRAHHPRFETRIASADRTHMDAFADAVLEQTAEGELRLYRSLADGLAVDRSSDGGQTWRAAGDAEPPRGRCDFTISILDQRQRLIAYRTRDPQRLEAVVADVGPGGVSVDWQRDRMFLDRRELVGKAAPGRGVSAVLLPNGDILAAYAYRDAMGTERVEAARWTSK